MRGSIVKLLAMMFILRDNPEGGGGGGGGSETSPDLPPVIDRPEHIGLEEWEGMSQSEREAMIETDEGEGAHQIIGTGEDTEPQPEGEEIDEKALAAIAGEEEPPAAAGGEETPAGTETPAAGGEETPSPTEESPVIVSEEALLAWRPVISDAEVPIPDTVPDEAQAKLDALDARIEEADGWLDAGEKPDETPFTRKDFRAIEKQVSQERQAVNREILQHQLTQRDIAKADLSWTKAQQAFKAARPDLFKSRVIEGALVATVNDMLKDPANSSKSDMQILIEAEREVRKELKLPSPGATPAEKPSTPSEKPAGGKPSAKDRPIPPNLAQVPIADEETIGNPFAAILKLSGEKFEEAIAKLSQAQQEQLDAYMAKQAR